MGPYMRPIPIGSTAAMLFSLVIAFTITPWAAVRVIKRHVAKEPEGSDGSDTVNEHGHEVPNDFFTRLYHKVMEPLLDKPIWRWSFLMSILALLLGSMSLVMLGLVEVKMLDLSAEARVVLVEFLRQELTRRSIG